ncbi:crotonase [Glaciecola punicea]|jgi:enoyl-CoA hydratase/carnithine racemase|uniref:enoyl-CoA hydratase/isomerase family protein n=1 Tax=Glaciecola punicea TaxID=56804 RepID=UPI000872E8AC|nr:enoyl-CoA hydratase/isomerase family protein [Glaciecola punicea]OFA29869.1 crotonase [Glaciecola punicea]
MSTISLTYEDNIARLLLNRPEKYNALTQSMWQKIAEACDQVEQEIKPRVLIVESASEKAFSAGADIQELQTLLAAPKTLAENNAWVQTAQQKLTKLSCATIAKLSGICVGGGLGIATACDFRVSSPQSRFAITPAKLGLVYSISDTRRLVNIIGYAKAKELLCTGKQIDANTALQWGLLTDLVEAEKLDAKVNEIAQSLCNASSYSICCVKQTLDYLAGANDMSEASVQALFDNAFKGDDFTEGAQAFLQKRTAKFI